MQTLLDFLNPAKNTTLGQFIGTMIVALTTLVAVLRAVLSVIAPDSVPPPAP